MVNILQSLPKTVHLSLVIAILLFLGLYFGGDGFAFQRFPLWEFETVFGPGVLRALSSLFPETPESIPT